MAEPIYRNSHDLDPASETTPAGGVPGKMPVTARLSGRSQIIFRVESAEAARELAGAFGPRDSNGVAAGSDVAVDRAASSSGHALPEDVRGRFESSLGTDLSGVRVHAGDASAQAASAVGAKAYTTGNDIHFGAGQYDPSSAFGVHLLAHEVAHTVQQQGAAPTRQNKLEVSAPQDAAETEADRAADAMVTGAQAEVSVAGGLSRKVMREPKATAGVNSNESVDRVRMGAMAADTAAMVKLLAACQANAATIKDDFDPKIAAAAKAYRKLAITFEAAREKVVARIEAHDKKASDRHAQVAGAVKFVLGKAIDLALGPEGLAIEAAVGMGVVGKKIVDTVKGAAIDGATELIVGKPPAKSAAVESTAGTEHENLMKLIKGSSDLIGHLSGLLQVSSVCGPALSTLQSHLEAHKNGGTATDGTNKSPSQLEASYRKLLPIKGMCSQVDVGSKSTVAHAKAAQTIAEAQAETDLLSAERQIWTRYQDEHPDAEEIDDPDSFGDKKRVYKSDGTSTVNDSKKDFVRQIGKEAQVVKPINTLKENSLLPAAGLLITPAPGSVTINGKTYRAVTREPTSLLPEGASCRVIDALVGANAEGKTAETDWTLVVDGGAVPAKAAPAQTSTAASD